jgi:hypothetical protein
MESLKQKWKKFDSINSAHQFYLKFIEKTEEKKLQKTTGKKPPEYYVDCSKCKKEVKLAFTAIEPKNNKFICFDCLV